MNWLQLYIAATPEERQEILLLMARRLDARRADRALSLAGQFRRFPRPIRTGMMHTFLFLLSLAFYEFPPKLPFIAVPMLWIVSLTATLTVMRLLTGASPRGPNAHWV